MLCRKENEAKLKEVAKGLGNMKVEEKDKEKENNKIQDLLSFYLNF